MAEQQQYQQKKRLRVPISCETCRRKKIKCDKKRPSCTGCSKSDSVCTYQEMKFNGSLNQFNNILNLGSFASSDTRTKRKSGHDEDMREELLKLRQKIQHIESNLPTNVSPDSKVHRNSDTINFYDGYSPLQINESRVFNHGPLSWVTLVKKDIHVRCIWTKVLSTNGSSLILHSMAKSVEEDIRDADDSSTNESESDNKTQKYSRKNIGHATTYRPDTEFGTVQMILRILPMKKHIWALIDRFFEVVYPFMPFLDYDNFMRQVVVIIGERSDELVNVEQLGIKKRLDFALAGVLLLILRFAYLSIQNNANHYSSPEMKQLAQLDISVEFPTAAQYCLNQFRLLRSSNLEILQCSLFMRLYHRYSPEDGDGADADSQIYNGMLLQMAISIGLNRDPEELLSSSIVNPKLCELRRKIWFALLQLETYHSLVLGSPSYTKVLSSNIKLPALNLQDFNSPSQDIEQFVIYWISKYSSRSAKLERVNELVLNLKGDSKICDVVAALEDVDSTISNCYVSFANVIKGTVSNSKDSIFKVRSLQSYLELSSATFCVYFHLFLKYDLEHDRVNSLVYLRKVMLISSELICGFTSTVNKLHKYVGFGFDYYLTHCFLITVHKAIQGQFSLFSRLQHYGFLLKIHGGQDDIKVTIKEIQTKILANLGAYLKELKKLTPKYYYAWKMFKAQNLIYQLLCSDDIFKIDNHRLVPNQQKNIVGDIPQYSTLARLSAVQLKNLYFDKIDRTADHQLVHGLNTITTTPTSTSSLSPDNNSSRGDLTSNSREVDDIWLDLLNKKKENDINENLSYGKFHDPEQQRQLQQPDFSSLLEMNMVFPKLLPPIDPQNAVNPVAVDTPLFDYNVSLKKDGLQQQQNQLNLNGLLEDPLNFKQLFGSSEYPFNDFL